MVFQVEMRGFLKNHSLEFYKIWQKDTSAGKWTSGEKIEILQRKLEIINNDLDKHIQAKTNDTRV